MTLKDFFLDLLHLDGNRDVNTAAPEPEVLKPIGIKKFAINPVELHTEDTMELSITMPIETTEGIPTKRCERYNMGEIKQGILATHAVRYELKNSFDSEAAVCVTICGKRLGADVL